MLTNPETSLQTDEALIEQEQSHRFRDVLNTSRQLLGRAVLAVSLASGILATQEVTKPEVASAETGGYPDADAFDCSSEWGLYSYCKDGYPDYNSSRGYAFRNCTDWVAYRLPQLIGKNVPTGLGNAKTWDDRITGATIDTFPEPGDIAQWNEGEGMGSAGHVEVVESVNENGTVNTSSYSGTTGNYSSKTGISAPRYIDLNGTGVGINGTPSQPGVTGGPDTIGIYDPTNAVFHIKDTNTPGSADIIKPYGNSNWIPLSGDWNNDSYFTPGAYDPETGTFYLSNSNVPGGPADVPAFTYGNIGWKPIVGDWNGNGYTSIGMYDPETATFYLRNTNSSGNADYTFQFGNIGWEPVAGDWDGMEDGNPATSIGVYNPSTATFYLNNETDASAAEYTIPFGNIGWTPLAGDWNGNGYSTIGSYNPNNSTFYLKNSHSSGGADVVAQYGNVGWKPVTGDWNGQ